jgi:hypothetical protein
VCAAREVVDGLFRASAHVPHHARCAGGVCGVGGSRTGVARLARIQAQHGSCPPPRPYEARIDAYTSETSHRTTVQPGDMVLDPEDDPGYLRCRVILVDISIRGIMPPTLDLPPELPRVPIG